MTNSELVQEVMARESSVTPHLESISSIDDMSLMRRARAIAGFVVQMKNKHAPQSTAIQESERIDGLVLLVMTAGSANLDPFAFDPEYIGLLGCAYHLVVELVLCRLNHEIPVPVYDRLYRLNLPAAMVEEIYACVEQIWDLVVVLRLQETSSSESIMEIVNVHAARLVIRRCLYVDLQHDLSEIENVLGKLQKYSRGHLKRIDAS